MSFLTESFGVTQSFVDAETAYRRARMTADFAAVARHPVRPRRPVVSRAVHGFVRRYRSGPVIAG
jgi:hypothetical protein